MQSTSRRLLLAASILVASALVATPQRTSLRGTLRGPAAGFFEQPAGWGQVGFLLGALQDASGSATIYSIQADLIDQGAACPACFIGLIEGTLDDGIGPGPDYLVAGSYAGSTIDGSGSLRADLFLPSGAFAGRLTGSFSDPDTLGTFRARWRLVR